MGFQSRTTFLWATLSSCRRLLSRTKNQETNSLVLILDLQVCPLAYDVASYLAAAEIKRRNLNLSTIFILVVPGANQKLRTELPEYESVVDVNKREWRLTNLVIPIFGLLPTVSGYSVLSTRKDATRFLSAIKGICYPAKWSPTNSERPWRREILDSGRNGGRIFPLFSAPTSAVEYAERYFREICGNRLLISITLRQYGYTPSRNSNESAWLDFARGLDKEKYCVIFVLDTEIAIHARELKYSEFPVFLPASLNIPLRMAIYQKSFVNLGIAQGPMELCWYNESVRYLMFLPLNSAELTSERAMLKEGFELHKDLPFSRPWQRWVWEKDDLENIRRSFETFMRDFG